MSEAFARSEVLLEVAPRLPDVEQALQLARDIEDAFYRSEVLLEVTRRLPDVEQFFLVAGDIEDARERSMALAEVARRLREAQRGDTLHQALHALRVARDIEEPIEEPITRSMELLAVARRLPDVEQALQVAGDIEDACYRSRALAEVARRLPEAQRGDTLRQALQVARDIVEPFARSMALAEVAPRLPDAQRSSTFEDAIAAYGFDVEAARSLGTALSTLAAANFLAHWPSWRRRLPAQGRTNLLKALPGLLPLFEQLGDPQDLKQVVAAIQEVGVRWP
jgi:hypothetical protein